MTGDVSKFERQKDKARNRIAKILARTAERTHPPLAQKDKKSIIQKEPLKPHAVIGLSGRTRFDRETGMNRTSLSPLGEEIVIDMESKDSKYKAVAAMLASFAIPSYVVFGDNASFDKETEKNRTKAFLQKVNSEKWRQANKLDVNNKRSIADPNIEENSYRGKILSECQTDWILMGRRVTRRLIWIQTVCKDGPRKFGSRKHEPFSLFATGYYDRDKGLFVMENEDDVISMAKQKHESFSLFATGYYDRDKGLFVMENEDDVISVEIQPPVFTLEEERQAIKVAANIKRNIVDTNIEENSYRNLQESSRVRVNGYYNRDKGVFTRKCEHVVVRIERQDKKLPKHGSGEEYTGTKEHGKGYGKNRLHRDYFLMTAEDFQRAANNSTENRLVYAIMHPGDCRLHVLIPVLSDSFLGRKTQPMNFIEEADRVGATIRTQLQDGTSKNAVNWHR